MARTQDPFQIPRAGLEIAPIAGLASNNVNGSVAPVPANEFVGESTLGGIVMLFNRFSSREAIDVGGIESSNTNPVVPQTVSESL